MPRTWTDKHVVIGLPTALHGGTQAQTRALAAALVRAGYTVTVCVYYQYIPDVLEGLRSAGAKVITLDLPLKKKFRYAMGTWRFMRRFGRVLRDERPQFVHIQYMETGLLPIATAKLAGVPRVLATVHVSADRLHGKAKFARRLAGRCDAFLCVSRSAEETFFGDSALFDEAAWRDGRRHFTIYNGIDCDEADDIAASDMPRRLRDELGLADVPVAGILARLRPVKGFDVLLDAWPAILEKCPAAKLLIVGDGSKRQRFRNKAKALGVAESIVWAGQQQIRRAHELLAAMDVVVAPSRSESFGLSVATAMAMGKAVVASNIGGLSELIDSGVSGRLFPVNDTAALADAVNDLLSDPAERERLGQAARTRIRSDFSMDAYAERHERLYRLLSDH